MLAVGLIAAACDKGPPGEDPATYVRAINQARADKDAKFLSSTDPVPAGRRAEFLPLSYFPPDPDYVVPAALKLAPKRTVVQMPTSTGQMRAMERVGTLEFSLKGQSMTLGAFVEAGSNVDTLFVPFTDLTSGPETYPAGRYLDLERTATGLYIVDFNKAYHPYCYYNPTYDCPYPPSENRLKLPVRAGERLSKAAATVS